VILTPEERRAVVTLAMLLAFGQAAAWWEKRESSKPDAELSAWLTHVAEIRAGGDTTSGGHSSALPASPHALLPTAESPPGGSDAHPLVASAGQLPFPTAQRADPHPEERRDTYERPPVPVRSSKAIPPGVLETGKLRINEATAEQLESLPGIGPSLAQRILAARRDRPFSSVEDLRRVSGIGPKILERLRPQIEIAPPQSSSDTSANPHVGRRAAPDSADVSHPAGT
jgi:competence ComEA-like helix-hairpin-helix protein